MTDYWGGWSADQPEFDGPDGGEYGPEGGDFDGPDGGDFGDLGADHPDDGGFPVEGFGAADPDPGDFATPADPPAPIGYDDLPGGPPADPYAEADPYPAEEPGFEPDGYPEVPAEAGFGAADPPVGADPDLDPYADTGPDWWEQPVPPDLGAPPEPVDGFPWADPGLLGQTVDTVPPPLSELDATTVDPGGLAEYAGEELPADGDPWSALTDSDDPATSTLARFWLPDER